ncbi:SGT1-domain-containing protein [Wallemia mellicola CBS 633.66]|nr:SGT1-domain-containing protein [Wallemia mellicola CBS 633.66]EIM22403.1 SGT1-domain-containing protein [Wallemia mellicola CBS 633.66]TIB92606.1 SGT1-domain-containing protein [Wallemia mellicola]|eukprot:XP_006957650.1 SGT1-domain-containing protein [Wallemia mellicola CBS 633.66]
MDGFSTLYYALYPSDNLDNKESLAALATLILSTVDQLLGKYEFLWHKDTFELTLNDLEVRNNRGFFLEGRMRVGESIQDEWITVWLLRELSKTYDFVIEIHDTDGQFLLIEAANELPNWLTPARADNRLWIHNGKLHLVPIDHTSPGPAQKRRVFEIDNTFDDLQPQEENDAWIDHRKAIQLVRNPQVETLASPSLEKAAFSRLETYPYSLGEHQHTFVAYLPPSLAKICAHTSAKVVSPERQTATSLTQKAIEAFATRDSAGTRAAQKMSRFAPDETTRCSVTVSRTAYAQMQGQKFYPPRVYKAEQWPNTGREREQREKGMRLACGFEILFDESKHSLGRESTRVHNPDADKPIEVLTENDPAFRTYIDKLAAVDFFKGEIEGSRLYNQRYEHAKRVWLSIREKESDDRFSFAQEVETLLKAPGVGKPTTDQDDDEKWMEIDATDFDDYLSQRMQASTASGAPDADVQASAATLGQFSDKLNAFVEGQGGVTEAKFADEEFSDDDGDSSGGSDEELDDADKRRIMDGLVPSLNQSEWGASTQSALQQEQQEQKDQTVNLSAAKEEDLLNKVREFADDPSETKQREEDDRLRRPYFEKEEYDGYSDSDDGIDEDTRNAERLKSAVKEIGDDEAEDIENLPQVEGDVDIDMGNEEEDFLAFSREALGIDDALWSKIISERKDRGAFVPSSTANGQQAAHTASPQPPQPPTKAPHTGVEDQHAKPARNDKLNSFEAVMAAMDDELAKTTGRPHSTHPTREDDDDQLRAMDQELKSILARVDPHDETLDDDEFESEELQSGDYSTMRNFLESFKAQSGLSGPVSNLAGSFGERLPRDHQ